jgi:predicted nucleotidyltransferase
MIDYSRADPRLLHEVEPLVDALALQAEVDGSSVLLVGAAARNVIHSALGHEFTLRATTDLDIGIAVKSWDAFERVENAFPRLGHTGLRFEIAGSNVDVVPFGEIEDPAGIATPTHRGEPVIVFGFDDVFAHAEEVALGSGRTIRIPQPAGYTALKLRAWVDRVERGEYKDAQDLAVAAYWYQESSHVENRLYGDEYDVLELTEYDRDRASVALLRRDVRAQLSVEGDADLSSRLHRLDPDLLASRLTLPVDAYAFSSLERRRAVVDQLIA